MRFRIWSSEFSSAFFTPTSCSRAVPAERSPLYQSTPAGTSWAYRSPSSSVYRATCAAWVKYGLPVLISTGTTAPASPPPAAVRAAVTSTTPLSPHLGDQKHSSMSRTSIAPDGAAAGRGWAKPPTRCGVLPGPVRKRAAKSFTVGKVASISARASATVMPVS